MNTQQAMQKQFRPELESQIMSLLFSDGFGFHEAYSHLDIYCRIIFGGVSKTGMVIIRQRLRSLEQSNLNH